MADASSSPEPAASPKLDDLMLAMDVVDTLRHDQRLIERELALGYSDDALIERLREIYKGQGIDVPDRVLEEGVKALKERRFSYEPPKPGLARSLALAWVDRWRIGKIVGAVLGAVLAIALLYHFAIYRPREMAELEARQELSVLLPKSLEAGYGAVLAEAKTDAAKSRAEQILADGKAAVARGEIERARRANAEIAALLAELRSEYELRIVNRPGEASGVWRKPGVNPKARNDYLIVEAVAPGGKVLQRPIRNEETGVTSDVEKWGVRVSDEVFQSVLADKRDDGIIEKNLVGRKRRGTLDVEYVIPVLGGAITKW